MADIATEITQAVEDKDSGRLRILLEQNPDVDLSPQVLQNVMVEAAREDWFDILHLLYDQNRVRGNNFTPGLLFNWINLEDPTLPPLLQQLNIPPRVKKEALGIALRDTHGPTVRALFNLGINLSRGDLGATSSLGYLDLDIAKMFPPRLLHTYRHSILRNAAFSNNVPVLRYIIEEYGARLEETNAVMVAAREGNVDVLSFIALNYPEEFHFTDNDLHFILRHGLEIDAIDFLMRKGIDMSIVPFDDMPPVGPAANIKKLLKFKKEYPNAPVISIYNRKAVEAIVAIMKSYMINRITKNMLLGQMALRSILTSVGAHWFD